MADSISKAKMVTSSVAPTVGLPQTSIRTELTDEEFDQLALERFEDDGGYVQPFNDDAANE